MPQVELTIEKKHIEHGVPGTNSGCPALLAMKEQLKKLIKPSTLNNMSVGTHHIFYNLRGRGEVVVIMPARLTHWINRWDSGATMRPTKVLIEVPDSTILAKAKKSL